MKNLITIIVISSLLVVLSCKPATSEEQKQPPKKTLPPNTSIIYDPNFKNIEAYGLYINKEWSDQEVDLLERIPQGLMLNTYDRSNNGMIASQEVLNKLLVKLIVMEQQLDLFLGHKEIPYPETVTTFTFDSTNENQIRTNRFLMRYFVEKERAQLFLLPYGTFADLSEDKTILPKVMVKMCTVDEKIKMLASAESINVDPKEFIRAYLKEQSKITN